MRHVGTEVWQSFADSCFPSLLFPNTKNQAPMRPPARPSHRPPPSASSSTSKQPLGLAANSPFHGLKVGGPARCTHKRRTAVLPQHQL
jgi:hypothetical protein